jgi:DNA polymerase
VDEYRTLVAARKACRICVAHSPGRIRSCGDFDFDPDVVSHWEQWLGHRRPKLVAVGQDFGNVDYFLRHRGRDGPHNKTSENLQKLLAAAGIEVGDPPERDPDAPVFMTNSVLCLKEGKMSAPILSRWVDACAEAHLLPLLRLLRPPDVVGMGSCGWRAVRRVLGVDDAPGMVMEAVGGNWTAADGTRVFAVCHPGPLGLTNRAWPLQFADWRRIGEALAPHPYDVRL